MNILSNNYLEINDDFLDKDDILNLYRLQKQLLIEEDIVATLEECANIWYRHSSDVSASWLDFPKQDEAILMYIKDHYTFTSFEEYAK